MKRMPEETALFRLRELYESLGYRRFQMSRFEEYAFYAANKDFLLSDQVITFTDASGKLMALKPDVTLSIIRHTPDVPGQVNRLYYHENVYRPTGAMGSFQEIMQAGLECVGDLTDYEAAEVVYLAAKSLEALGEDFVLDLSHMGLVAAALAASGLGKEGQRQAMTCLRQKNAHGIRQLCAQAGAQPEGLLALADFSGGAKELGQLSARLPGEAQQKALEELTRVFTALEQLGLPGRVQVDFSCGGDLRYYSGLVFQGYLPGLPRSILSGGQYDKLPAKMGKTSRAIGFAVYLDLLESEQPEEEPLYCRVDPTGADCGQILAAVRKMSTGGRVLVSGDSTVPARCVLNFEGGEAVLHG